MAHNNGKPFEDDVIPVDGQVSEAKKLKRLKELNTWFSRFVGAIAQVPTLNAHLVQFDPDGASAVNEVYWELMQETVRPKITPCNGGKEVRADRHKICSLTELMIVHCQPIINDDDKSREHWNALLAYFCALNILGNWNKADGKNIDWHVSDSFKQAHIAWLENIAPGSERMPIFSNAATWYLAEEFCLQRHRAKVKGYKL